MAIKKTLNKIFIVLFFLTCVSVYAKDRDEDLDYYFEMEDDVPVFTQILRWEEVKNASKYEIVIFNYKKQRIKRDECKTEEYKVQLKPGNYFYKIGAYNLLGMKEQTTDYIPLQVRKAVIPKIKGVSPDIIYLDDVATVFEVIVPGADENWKVYLKNTDDKVIYPKEITAEGDVLSATFKNLKQNPGDDFVVYVEHPSGLTGDVEKGIKLAYRRPLSFYFNVGWDPAVLLYTNEIKRTTGKLFFPVSGKLTLGLIVLKRATGFFGGELSVNTRYIGSNISNKTSSSMLTIDTALDLLYEYHFTNRFFGLFMFGGGFGSAITLGETPSYVDTDFQLRLGTGIRWQFHPRLHCGITAGWVHWVSDPLYGTFVPEIYFGFRY
ncbi:MAG: hypothetical protein CR988_03215 [Treponema sp.]|nr:MAG: hypothetical protein CR988_03215 [Treponema sp.]